MDTFSQLNFFPKWARARIEYLFLIRLCINQCNSIILGVGLHIKWLKFEINFEMVLRTLSEDYHAFMGLRCERNGNRGNGEK